MTHAVPCRRPASCGARSHRAGTAAAAACALDTPGRAPASMAADVMARPRSMYGFGTRERALARPDPSGGYTSVRTSFHIDGRREVGYYLGRACHHRADGPAVVRLAADGSVSATSWYLSGQLHREDGPAHQGGPVSLYCLEGLKVGDGGDAEHLGDLVEAGADPATVVRWLRVADREVALEMVAAGHDLAAVEGELAAGTPPGALGAVLGARAPRSWARPA